MEHYAYQIFKLTIKDLPKPNEAPRAEGLHTGEVIRALLSDDRERTDQLFIYAEGGFTFEKMLEKGKATFDEAWKERMAERLLPQGVVRPPEVQCPTCGVYCNGDGLDPDALYEYKAQWASSKKMLEFDKEFRKWIWQVAHYCYVYGRRLVHFYIYFVCGNWRPPVPEIYRVDLVFTEEGIEHFEKMFKAQAERMRKENGNQDR